MIATSMAYPAGSAVQAPTIHVYIVQLETSATKTEACERSLNPIEAHRASRFYSDTMRRRWVVGRGRLRQILAEHTGLVPEQIEFEERAKGKPMLRAGSSPTPLYFNLSHSCALALIALSDWGELGIDVEFESALPSWPAVAERVFTYEERAQINAAATDERQHLFYRCWTRKEAVIKATGEGLSANLTSFAVSVDRDARLLKWPDGDVSEWHLAHIEPAAEYVGALAIRWSVAPRIVMHR